MEILRLFMGIHPLFRETGDFNLVVSYGSMLFRVPQVIGADIASTLEVNGNNIAKNCF